MHFDQILAAMWVQPPSSSCRGFRRGAVAARTSARRAGTPWPAVRAGWSLILCTPLSAGTIATHVQPVPPETSLPSLCVEENDTVWSKEFLLMLRDELARRGIRTSVYNGTLPAGCRYHLTYTASWYWDVAVDLKYADPNIYDGDTVIGGATYDARHASARMDKFGGTFGKLDPLLDELLRRTPDAAPATGS